MIKADYNRLHKVAFKHFKDLQQNFICQMDSKAVLKHHSKNLFIVTFIEGNNRCSTKRIESVAVDRINFTANCGFVFERNEYFDHGDVSYRYMGLLPNQFIAAVRLGSPMKTDLQVQLTEEAGLTRSYFQFMSSASAQLVYTYEFRIRDIRCHFPLNSAISERKMFAIHMAVQKCVPGTRAWFYSHLS